MRTKLIIIACTAAIVTACTATFEYALKNKTLQPMAESNCQIPKPVSDLLSKGSRSRAIWEHVFREVKDDEIVQAFLADWQLGDTYSLIRVTCFTNHNPKIHLEIDFTTPRLGTAVINSELLRDEIVVHDFFLSSLLSIIE